METPTETTVTLASFATKACEFTPGGTHKH